MPPPTLPAANSLGASDHAVGPKVSTQVRDGLTQAGLNLRDSYSQIIPVEAGGEREVMNLRDHLEAHGIFGSVFCPPATPRNRSMVRLSLHTALTDADTQRLVTACRAAARYPMPNGAR
ncbi:hypothetical protein OG897_03910 [Streptomyces sp. NBC_00237]|uniref:hypothetical protein n=1 Tax=Streptomyces sp. NBC_00237 TaxID=2975687 RepID=UPI0022537674|nr:hypothetical protein [Streptomyces sp. NBC_00237]MCX5200611.1 hypothetical protein [Streptomyces sp. NBC_00237]